MWMTCYVFLTVNVILKFFLPKLILFIGVSRRPGPPPPIEMLPMIRMSQKRLLFRLFQFLLATLRTTVHAYNGN